jgi:hypothetical protein
MVIRAAPDRLDETDFSALTDFGPQVVVAFFSRAAVRHGSVIPALQRATGACLLIGCSTAGEIGPEGAGERGLVALALRGRGQRLRSAAVDLADTAASAAAGHALARELSAPDLASVLVFAPGNDVDGAALTDALCEALAPDVHVFGGLAGDGGALVDGPAAGLGAHLVASDGDGTQTWTLLDDTLATRRVVAVGWYGEPALTQSMHSGARAFGPLRRVTRAEGATLYELDGEPALDIYRRYLGRYADELPASGLLFPFSVLTPELAEAGLVRTLVDIDESARSLILGGPVAVGDHLRLMHASADNLARGAGDAARTALACDVPPSAALLISCVDRKLVLGDRVDDEIDAVRAALGDLPLIGFYANGEIGRPAGDTRSRLNNQTMAVACFT